MLKLHAFSPNFQPAHSPELCGRREDKLAASALGGNAKLYVSIVCLGSRCQQLQLPGDLTWKQKVPAPHRVGKKGSPHWLREVGKRCQAQFSGTKPHDANPGFLDWLRKNPQICFIPFVSLTNDRSYAHLKIHHFLPRLRLWVTLNIRVPEPMIWWQPTWKKMSWKSFVVLRPNQKQHHSLSDLFIYRNFVHQIYHQHSLYLSTFAYIYIYIIRYLTHS